MPPLPSKPREMIPGGSGDPEKTDAVFLRLLHWLPPPAVPQRTDCHDWHEAVVVLRGRYEVVVAGELLTVHPGQVVYYAPGVSHSPQPYRVVTELAFIQWRQDQTVAPPRRLLVTDRGERLQMVCRWMLELQKPARQEQRQALEALFLVFVYEHAQLSGMQEDALAARIRAFILSQLDRRMRLGDLAQVAGMSKFHFARLFRRIAGETPMECLRRMRVEAAQSLLESTHLPHKAIAERVGLGTEAHLYRIYKRVKGCNPSDVRRRSGNLKGQDT